MRRSLIICLLLAGVTLGLYWPLTHFGLVYYDDPLFLTDSPEIQSGLNVHSFLWSFTSVILANCHPLTTLSFVVDHQLFGTNPGAEHLVNVVLHTANVVLLFLLLRSLTGSIWRSALVAAVFAWHPLRVESVAWITERKDVLSGFFFFLTLLAYTRYVKASPSPSPGSKVWYGLSLLALALGLMSKAMLVTVPFVLLLLDVWPLQRLALDPPGQLVKSRILPRLFREKVPFFALALGFAVLTFFAQKNASGVVSLNYLGWNYRIANAITSYGRYLGKLFYPVDLSAIYPYVRIDDWGQTGMLALVLAGVTALCLRGFRTRPWLVVGWFWYLGMSLPIIGLIQVGEAAMADRYTYLTLIGPVLALVWLIPESWFRRGGDSLSSKTAAVPILLLTSCAAILAALLLLTSRQIQTWRDTISLFSHALAVTGPNPGAEGGLAVGLERAGQLDEALAHYRRAQTLNPDDPDNFAKSGHLLMQQKHWAEAAADIQQVLALQPDDFYAHENLGVILPQLGRGVEGLQHWQTAAKIRPDALDLLNNLAWLLATSPDPALRDGPQAVQLAERACQLTGWQKTICLGTLAAAYAEAGRFDDAIATAQKACTHASAQGEADLLQRNQQLLALYQQHQPWHDPVPPPSP